MSFFWISPMHMTLSIAKIKLLVTQQNFFPVKITSLSKCFLPKPEMLISSLSPPSFSLLHMQ